jgi:hypothetical protein
MTRTRPSPGPWLRLTALAATAATGLVVATGESALSHGVAALVAVALAFAAILWLESRFL